ncbi:MAG: helix-turn-helix transcriptional regulator [Lachnospiraceae bacterium]|nr:helix-turn-helix transcriptional regulator [Lachnospiraceae bacterium]
MEGKTETTVLSSRIAALRKNRGLTQEQLGALVGVTAQAVSKWEKGGAPDVELLPSLAEHLGVSIDTLFGRSEQELERMPERLSRWLSAQPPERRVNALFDLLCALFPTMLDPLSPLDISCEMPDNCYWNDPQQKDGEKIWLRSKLVSEEGLVLAVQSKNFPLYLVLPEPPKGYEQHLAENDDYRRLFAVLSKPGALEILRFLYGKKRCFHTPAAVAKRLHLSTEETEALLKEMEGCHLVEGETLEIVEGTLSAYILHDTSALVPFLYFARWFMEQKEAWLYGWDTRKRPILLAENAEEAGK